MKRTDWLAAVATLALAYAAPHAQAEQLRGEILCGPDSPPLPGFTPAEVSAKPSPRYPSRALDDWSEGWVRAHYTITVDGKVADLIAIDALGPKPFVDETLRALRVWTYKPARRNGVPVDQYGYETIFEYRMADTPERAAVHREFVKRYNDATALIREKKYAEALELLERALKLRTNRYESAMASFALAVTNAQLKNWRAALLHIRHATIFDNDLLEPSVRPAALALRVQLEVDDGNYKSAVCAYKDLLKASPQGDPTAAKIVAQVDAALKNPAPLAIQGRLETNPAVEGPATWSHPLLRARFHFENIQGDAKSFRLVCTGTVFEAAIDSEIEWNVPDAAGECTLRVEGAPGAQFHLIEEW